MRKIWFPFLSVHDVWQHVLGHIFMLTCIWWHTHK
jgi:hypothetical protein